MTDYWYALAWALTCLLGAAVGIVEVLG